MIYPEKTITDNPFVDNILYYSKLMALNSTVKDEEEALSYETPNSLRARETLISSVEGNATYEVYNNIPKEILEKYIPAKTNLDVYAGSNEALKIHMESYSIHQRTKIMNEISSVARLVYADHYEIIMDYLNDIGDTWFEDNKPLYDKCKALEATYEDLFNVLPQKTVYRILNTYINNYDNTDIESLSKSLNLFKEYVNNRIDDSINEEITKINKAMMDVFISHYNIMVERDYVRDQNTEWRKYIDEKSTYERCLKGISSYYELYDLFPEDSLLDSLNTCIGEDIVQEYRLMNGVNILDEYIKKYSSDPKNIAKSLTDNMSKKYIKNYGSYVNFEIYNLCLDGLIDYYELAQYLPFETRKMVINSQIKEITNLDLYCDDKKTLNYYLATLPRDKRIEIKNNITKDMHTWYPKHHYETNNYYRALIALPPLDDNGNIMIDTLEHSWDDKEKQFKEFGNRFISRIPQDIYPMIHWKQNIYDFDAYDIGILQQYGILEDWIDACKADINSSRYRYLKYLGDNKLDLYTCSKALNFQLIGIPTIDDSDFKRKFIDKYAINRDYTIRTVYSDSHKFQSDYYNKFIILFIILNTIMDMLTSIPDYIIDRDVFDSRCIKYLFESFGIPYYSEIPIKYQKAMLKNLNILIKFKSSTKNMVDICSLFGFSDVRVFGYYLFKERCVDSNTGEYQFDEDNDISYELYELYVKDDNGIIEDYNGIRFTRLLDYRNYDEEKYTKEITYEENGVIKHKRIIRNDADVYLKDGSANDFIPLKDAEYFKKIKAEVEPAKLKFIKVPIDESVIDYKNDPDYIVPYDEMVYQDEGNTWDGGEEHQHLYNRLVDHEFNAVKSKYISVETVTEMTELAFQVSYFYNMLFDNMYSEDALTVEIPYIKIGHKFRFMDIVCYLFALMYLYNGIEDNIMYSPTQILYIKGYNFNNDLNTVLQDAKAFQQNNPLTGEIYEDYQKYNIFDINERIKEDSYDYREAFKDYNMRAFNLDCDIDALEKWLNDNYQMSLDDFVVDDTLTKFSQVITLRNFFSLNNSYYQKNIFVNNLYPIPFNQDIKYAFDYELYLKKYIGDINEILHEYVVENDYFMEIISDTNNILYIMDHSSYIKTGYYGSDYVIYYKYFKQNDGSFKRINNIIYIKNKDNEFEPLFNKEIGIVDSNGNYIFSADNYYTKNEDGLFTEITDNKYFIEDPNKRLKDYYDENSQDVKESVAVVPYDNIVDIHKHIESESVEDIYKHSRIIKDIDSHNELPVYKKALNFGQYYIYKDGKWVLDPNNCYIKVVQNGKEFYILASESEDYGNIIVKEEDCYVRRGTEFICLTETDYYKKKISGEEYNGYVYTEEDCFIITTEETQFYDPNANPRVYYKKLTDYYKENNYTVYANDYYIKDYNGEYISEKDLIDPNNCYYDDNGVKLLVADALAKILPYKNAKDVRYELILQKNNDYYKYKLDNNNNYIYFDDTQRQYVINSIYDYITVLYKTALYDNTKNIIVVLNKPLSSYDKNTEILDKYDPELTDGVWDENDWYYTDEYKGEHQWYYKPKALPLEPDEESHVGSGYYLEASSYLGDTNIIKGERYYLALDLETNFSGSLQVRCDADSGIENSQSNIYEVIKGERTHITQVFIANEIKRPGLKFLIYNYDENPINVGDYINISNIRFVKSHSSNFIAQDIQSYDKLQELYRTNEAIYKYLIALMNNTDDINTYNIYKKLYDSLMISKYNKEAFKIGETKYAKTYTDFLETRDAVLYEQLSYFKSLDEDAMHKQVADNIVEVTYAIDDCVDTYSYGYLYSYFPAVSASYIQQYIIKIINFFKSWKVHLLGINTVYKFDDKFENTIKILEKREVKGRIDSIKPNVFINDIIKINPLDDINISGERYNELYPDLYKYTDNLKDKYNIRDRVKIISSIANNIDHIYDNDNNLHLVLNDERSKVSTNDGVLKINHPTSSFKTGSENYLIMQTPESDQSVFGVQKMDDNNRNTINIKGE